MLRNSLRLTALCAGLLLGANAMAVSLGSLSQGDASGGLKDALTQGAQTAQPERAPTEPKLGTQHPPKEGHAPSRRSLGSKHAPKEGDAQVHHRADRRRAKHLERDRRRRQGKEPQARQAARWLRCVTRAHYGRIKAGWTS